ncbi:MAG: hypothetical protein J6O40_04340 [Ruminococcus sp.]|nr:hypothetical protein [Ruminococcus sp.]
MSIKKRLAAIATAAIMAASLVGCADTSYVISADGENINAGVYIDYMFSSMQQQIYMWQYTGVTENFFDQKVGDQSFEDYLKTTAMDQTKRFAAVEKLFKESGLKISSEDMKTINNSVSDTWENVQKLYETEGISKDSLKKITVNSKKEEMLFDYYYGTDGKEAVSKDDLVKYMNDNYLRYKGITIYKSTNEDETQKEAENKKNQELFEKYKEKAEGVKFADFDALIDEYTEETTPAEETEIDDGTETVDADDSSVGADDSSAADESSESTVDSSADDTSSETESSTSDDSSETVAEDSVSSFEAAESDDESSVTEVSTSEDDSSAADETTDSETADSETTDSETAADDTADELTDEEAVEAEDTAEAEPDPYPNDRLTNFANIDEDSLEEDYGKRMKAIKDAAVDEIVTYEDDNAYYIVSKGDITERSSEYLDDETQFDTILHEAKDEDFDSKLKAVQDKINFSENSDALDRYTPKTVYNKYNDYMDQNSKANA